MGQEMSRRHSDDTLSFFPPLGNSTTSLESERRLDDAFHGNYKNKKKFKKCSRFSQIKKSLTKCFKNNFHHLHEIDSDNDEGIMSVQQTVPEDPHHSIDIFNISDLPMDIHDIHNNLRILLNMLSDTDNDVVEVNTRDISCQTIEYGTNIENLLRQKDSFIRDQQDQLNHLKVELESKNQTIERYIRELTILKVHQSRQRLENNNTNQLITFLKDLRIRGTVVFSDFDKIDEIIDQISSFSGLAKNHVEKSNVAVINPCSNSTNSSTSLCPSFQTDFQTPSFTSNHFINKSEEKKDGLETKLICFLDHSVTPYISSIPLSSSSITLSHVKYYTKSVMPNNVKCRYFFRSTTINSSQTQEEVFCDSDMVPVHDNKIVVRIRM